MAAVLAFKPVDNSPARKRTAKMAGQLAARGWLTDVQVKSLLQVRGGPHRVGPNTSLVCTHPGVARCEFRYKRNGKPHWVGLGKFRTVAELRERADAMQKLLDDGLDPLEQKAAQKHAQAVAEAKACTFRQVAEQCIASLEAGWKSPKHAAQWRSTLARYVYPAIGNLPVADIDAAAVLRVLPPALWNEIPETANRIRGRIEQILDFARVHGWRDGPNPAIWRGNLSLTRQSRNKIQPVEHHEAMDWRQMRGFMSQLAEVETISALALRFLILTAARSGEVRSAKWGEIDIQGKCWTIPASKMKAGQQHKIPLTEAAMDVLRLAAPWRRSDELIFPGMRLGVVLSDVTLAAVLRRMGLTCTVHGFRSSFRDWAAESTNHPNHVVEQALAHAIGSRVEAAYRRGDLFEKRQQLMADWSAYCT